MVTSRCFPAYVCSLAFTTRVRLYRTYVRSIRTRVSKMCTNICGNSSELPPQGHSLFLGLSCFLCTYFSLNLCYLLYDSMIQIDRTANLFTIRKYHYYRYASSPCVTATHFVRFFSLHTFASMSCFNTSSRSPLKEQVHLCEPT